MSRATRQLRLGKREPCAHCGRTTITTSDGICAECWGSKGGVPMVMKRGRRESVGVWDILLAFVPLGWWWRDE